MKYLTIVEMSEKWNISPRRIGVLCAQNCIKGAIKKGKTWLTQLMQRNQRMLVLRVAIQRRSENE